MFRVVNIKYDNPSVDYALLLLDQEIKYSKAIGNHGIIVIHGYGSHGKGGAIKDSLKSYLPELKKKLIIDEFVFGEMWSDSNPVKQRICKICPELILHDNLQNLNSGVTVLLV